MFFTFPPALLGAIDVIDRIDDRWQRSIRKFGRRPQVDVCARSTTRIDRIDDPDGTTRLVRIVGTVTPSVLPCVLRAWADMTSPQFVHIDLTDAVISDLTTMLAFERAIDHLERQEIGIRIVGLDPAHPALTA